MVDDASVNAFALPGGQIFVTRGLCAHADNAAQLATVIGHEIGHVTARHSVQRMSQQELISLGLGVGMVISDKARQFEPLASAGLSVLFLKFSRNDEYQADKLGVRYASRPNYDVREMPDMFRMLERVSEESGGGRLPEWLSTHPEPEHRIERVSDEIAKTAQAETNRASTATIPQADRRPGLRRRPARRLRPRRAFLSAAHALLDRGSGRLEDAEHARSADHGDGRSGCVDPAHGGSAKDPQQALEKLAQSKVWRSASMRRTSCRSCLRPLRSSRSRTKTRSAPGLVTYVLRRSHVSDPRTRQAGGRQRPHVRVRRGSLVVRERVRSRGAEGRAGAHRRIRGARRHHARDAVRARTGVDPARPPGDTQPDAAGPALHKGMLVKWVRGGSEEVPEEAD